MTGGAVGVLLMTLLTASVISSATRYAASGVVVPAVFTAMLLVTWLQEVSYGVVDRGFLLAVVVAPLAVIAMSRPSSQRSSSGSLLGPPVEGVVAARSSTAAAAGLAPLQDGGA